MLCSLSYKLFSSAFPWNFAALTNMKPKFKYGEIFSWVFFNNLVFLLIIVTSLKGTYLNFVISPFELPTKIQFSKTDVVIAVISE